MLKIGGYAERDSHTNSKDLPPIGTSNNDNNITPGENNNKYVFQHLWIGKHKTVLNMILKLELLTGTKFYIDLKYYFKHKFQQDNFTGFV